MTNLEKQVYRIVYGFEPLEETADAQELQAYQKKLKGQITMHVLGGRDSGTPAQRDWLERRRKGEI